MLSEKIFIRAGVILFVRKYFALRPFWNYSWIWVKNVSEGHEEVGLSFAT